MARGSQVDRWVEEIRQYYERQVAASTRHWSRWTLRLPNHHAMRVFLTYVWLDSDGDNPERFAMGWQYWNPIDGDRDTPLLNIDDNNTLTRGVPWDAWDPLEDTIWQFLEQHYPSSTQ
eukprot:jgi/Chrzof1/5873/Cz16g18260.t1